MHRSLKIPLLDSLFIFAQDIQVINKLCARDLFSAEACQMRGVDLAIDQANIPGPELTNQPGKGDFGSIRDPAEHGFTKEYPAYCDAIQAANQPVFKPAFH